MHHEGKGGMAGGGGVSFDVGPFVADRVREHRERMGMTQIELAAAARMRRPTIAAIEACQVEVRLSHLLRIGDALGVAFQDLVPPLVALPPPTQAHSAVHTTTPAGQRGTA